MNISYIGITSAEEIVGLYPISGSEMFDSMRNMHNISLIHDISWWSQLR